MKDFVHDFQLLAQVGVQKVEDVSSFYHKLYIYIDIGAPQNTKMLSEHTILLQSVSLLFKTLSILVMQIFFSMLFAHQLELLH